MLEITLNRLATGLLMLALAGPASAATARQQILDAADRAVQKVVEAPAGKRYRAARALMPKLAPLGEVRFTRALVNVVAQDGIELADRALALPAGSPLRATAIQEALGCLADIPSGYVGAFEKRGLLRVAAGDVAGAVADFETALKLDPGSGGTRRELARLKWRAGEHEAAIQLMDAGLRAGVDRDGTELFARMLRWLKRSGQGPRATKLAQEHAELLAGNVISSPLHVLLTEFEIEEKNLDRAMDAYLHTQVGDRTWLVGGLVRAGRQLGQTAEGRKSVYEALERLPKTASDTPASLLRLAGDLKAADGQTESALRHYAASITGGDEEARDIVQRLRARGATAAIARPGSIVGLLASAPGVAMKGQRLVPDFRMADQLPPPATEVVQDLDLEMPQPVRPENPGPPVSALDAATRALGILGAPGIDVEARVPSLVNELSKAARTPVSPTRKRLLAEVLRNDVAGASATLDALALTSWQTNRRVDLGLRAAIMPATASYEISPVTNGMVRPEAIDEVNTALREMNDPKSTPARRLETALEVSRQESEPMPPIARDPIVIDMDGSGGIELTEAWEEKHSVKFDLEGYGTPQQIQWLAHGHDGWLCEDTDHDGKIASGRELFGTAGGYSDGFEKLALRDADGNGKIEGAELAGLSIWVDDANPGVTDPGELISVQAAGVDSITIPRVGLRSVAVIKGVRRLCVEVWPEAFNSRFAAWSEM